MCLAQGYITVTPVRLEPAVSSQALYHCAPSIGILKSDFTHIPQSFELTDVFVDAYCRYWCRTGWTYSGCSISYYSPFVQVCI